MGSAGVTNWTARIEATTPDAARIGKSRPGLEEEEEEEEEYDENEPPDTMMLNTEFVSVLLFALGSLKKKRNTSR